jgi:hypothetical protein
MAIAWEQIGGAFWILYLSWFPFLLLCPLLYSRLPKNRKLSWQGCFFFLIVTYILPAFAIRYFTNSLPALFQPGTILSTISCLVLPALFSSIIPS